MQFGKPHYPGPHLVESRDVLSPEHQQDGQDKYLRRQRLAADQPEGVILEHQVRLLRIIEALTFGAFLLARAQITSSVVNHCLFSMAAC